MINDKNLETLINDFNTKLEIAQDARAEIMDYLQEQYSVDTNDEWETIENECDWCYGVDLEGIEAAIKRAKEEAL